VTAAAHIARDWAIELPVLVLLALASWNWPMSEVDDGVKRHLSNQAASSAAARDVLARRMEAGPIRNYEVGALVKVLQAMHGEGHDLPAVAWRHEPEIRP
jgi:hypothetical protein